MLKEDGKNSSSFNQENREKEKRHFVWNSKKILCIFFLCLIALYNHMERILFTYILIYFKHGESFISHKTQTFFSATCDTCHMVTRLLTLMNYVKRWWWCFFLSHHNNEENLTSASNTIYSLYSTTSLSFYRHVMWKITQILVIMRLFFFFLSETRWKFLYGAIIIFKPANVSVLLYVASTHLQVPGSFFTLKFHRHMFDNFIAQLNTFWF